LTATLLKKGLTEKIKQQRGRHDQKTFKKTVCSQPF